jgi:hypothetical protein
LTITIAVVEALVGASGVLRLINEVVRASASSADDLVTEGSLPAWVTLASATDAFSVVTVNVQARVLVLASVTEESIGADANSWAAGTAVGAVNTTARVLVSAVNSFPAGSANADSVVAWAAVEARFAVAGASGLTGADSALAGSLSVALAWVVAFAVSENVGGLVSEVFLLTAVSGVTLAELKPVASSSSIAVAVVAASG